MAETPDFDRVAQRLADSTSPDAIVDQLRAIWNARGTADIAKIETDLSILMGAASAVSYIGNLTRAIRKLDR
jgi:hypothetical protein